MINHLGRGPTRGHRRWRHMLLAASLTATAFGTFSTGPAAAAVCPPGFASSSPNIYAPTAPFSLVFRRGGTNTTGQLQMYIRSPLGVCRRDARAGSGKSGWNENQTGGGPLPLGNYTITAVNPTWNGVIKGWRAQLTMVDQPASQAVSANGTRRTDLYLHSEMRANGDFGRSYVTPPAPMTLPDGTLQSFTAQPNPAGDQADLWEGVNDYASLGCIKVAPVDAAILENLRSHFPYLAVGTKLTAVA